MTTHTIETLLPALAAEHDVTTITLAFRLADDPADSAWNAGVHWDGFSHCPVPYASGWGATPALAFDAALKAMKAKRAPLSLNDATVDLGSVA